MPMPGICCSSLPLAWDLLFFNSPCLGSVVVCLPLPGICGATPACTAALPALLLCLHCCSACTAAQPALLLCKCSCPCAGLATLAAALGCPLCIAHVAAPACCMPLMLPPLPAALRSSAGAGLDGIPFVANLHSPLNTGDPPSCSPSSSLCCDWPLAILQAALFARHPRCLLAASQTSPPPHTHTHARSTNTRSLARSLAHTAYARPGHSLAMLACAQAATWEALAVCRPRVCSRQVCARSKL